MTTPRFNIDEALDSLVKKDLQILQQMIGPDLDALELIHLARQRVKQNVVVKWPQKAKSLLPSTFSVHGKTVRFDVYCRLGLGPTKA